MPATLDGFYQRVSRAVRRGQVYDEDIPGYAKDAVRILEDEFNWLHMWQEDAGALSVAPSPGTNGVDNILDLGAGATIPVVKSVRVINLVATNGRRTQVYKTTRDSLLALTPGRPRNYWMTGQNVVAFDAFPTMAYPYEIGWYRYSPIDDSLPWLTLAEDLLMAQTIMGMQPVLRDDKIIQRWGMVRSSRLDSLHESQIMHTHDGEDNSMIPYVSEVEQLSGVDLEFE